MDPLLPHLPEALRHWSRRDPVLAALARRHPPPVSPYSMGEGFATMLHSIVSQQVSLAAGRAIWGRLVQGVGGAVTADAVLAAGPERLRGFGLSRAKAAYALDLAGRTRDGAVAWGRFDALPDAAIVEELTAVKGIGPWTAKMYLLFHLHRPDVSVPEDVGLQDAVARFYGVARKEAPAFLRNRAPLWSPWNSLAGRVLWEARRAEPAAGVQPAGEAGVTHGAGGAVRRSRGAKAPLQRPS